jgi:sortase (surface protein transpeptidase)
MTITPPSANGPSAEPSGPRGRLPKAALPGLLLVGCLGGIGAIMVGLLTFLDPSGGTAQAGGVAAPAVAQVAGMERYSPPTVGPGGPGVPLTAAAPSAPPPLPAIQPAQALTTDKAVRPKRLQIERIGVNAPLRSVGVTKTKAIQVPPLSQPQVAGWYRLGPVPGQLGPAVILGHVNTRRGPAVFSRLRELQRGDKIQVVLSDGSVAEFTVDGVEQVGKTTFPTGRVYGNVNAAGLRLITCGGVFNPKVRSYTDNIIVYATLSSTHTA